jgi:hypothetical protein
MLKKKTRKKQLLALLWVLLAAAAVTAATYAWFTFNPYTNVEPMSSTVSGGDISLLISNTSNGDFDVSCALTPTDNPDVLQPVSTSNLEKFYTVTAQNTEGISILYRDSTEQMSEKVIHGTVYLESLNGGCDVYFYQSGLSFGSDSQTLASMRLGLLITTNQGTSSYIFKLDDMGNVSTATSSQTVPDSGTVVSAIGDDGTPTYTSDPAESLSNYFAVENGDDDQAPEAGEKLLCSLQADEVASVEYWLYLEGCDDNCFNDVQNKDLSLQLSFAGVAND